MSCRWKWICRFRFTSRSARAPSGRVLRFRPDDGRPGRVVRSPDAPVPALGFLAGFCSVEPDLVRIDPPMPMKSTTFNLIPRGSAPWRPGGPPRRRTRHAGEQIYRRQCASCHGAAGEGSEDYPQAARRRPLGRPARAADRQDDARGRPRHVRRARTPSKVAAYIYDAFYSQDRPGPQQARPDRAVAADRPPVPQRRRRPDRQLPRRRPAGTTQRGLQGEYFKARRFRNGERVIDRRRPRGPVRLRRSQAPTRTSSTPHEFSIRWEGSVLAPETGEYEFIVRTEHAARLWVNDPKQPLIDAWVKSGNDTEYRGVDLPARRPGLPAAAGVLQGQAGRGRLEEEEASRRRSKASIALEWKLPQRAAEVIPRRNLSPGRFPETFVVDDAVPAGRPQRRLRARHVGLEGVGPGDDRRGDRGRRLRRRPTSRELAGRRRRRRRPRDASSASSAAGSPSGPSAGR